MESLSTRKKSTLDSIDIVVCVTSDTAEEVLRRCVDSVLAFTPPLRRLILVNDGSVNETSSPLGDVSDQLDKVEFLKSSGEGYTRAMNRGLRASSGDLVVVLAGDAVVTPGWAEGLLACARSSSQIGIVGPLSNAASWQSVPERFELGGTLASNRLPEGLDVEEMAQLVASRSQRAYPRVGFLDEFCFGINRRLIPQIGVFNEDSFPEGDGAAYDFGLRAQEAGFTLAVADDAWVYRTLSENSRPVTYRELSPKSLRVLESEYGREAIRTRLEALQENPELAEIREGLSLALNNGSAEVEGVAAARRPRVASAGKDAYPRVLFILPTGTGGGGGVHMIVENAVGMRALGCDAQVAVPAEHRETLLDHYPDLESEVFRGFSYETLPDLGGEYDVVIATLFTSVKWVEEICRRNPKVLPAYFIQDYEPWFVEIGSELEQEAFESYNRIPDMVSFALTDWMTETIAVRHGAEVSKVVASLDTEVFHPPPDMGRIREEGPVRVTAMVRPSTPRRNAWMTMDVMRSVAHRMGDQVHIVLFGCTSDDPGFLAMNSDFPYDHRGVLQREGVADVLRECDVFADFSVYQALGRTALEAMACACSTVVPQAGGATDYATDGHNALVVDTTSKAAMEAAIVRLVEDHRLRGALIREGLRTASKYSIVAAAASELTLFQEALARRSG